MRRPSIHYIFICVPSLTHTIRFTFRPTHTALLRVYAPPASRARTINIVHRVVRKYTHTHTHTLSDASWRPKVNESHARAPESTERRDFSRKCNLFYFVCQKPFAINTIYMYNAFCSVWLPTPFGCGFPPYRNVSCVSTLYFVGVVVVFVVVW